MTRGRPARDLDVAPAVAGSSSPAADDSPAGAVHPRGRFGRVVHARATRVLVLSAAVPAAAFNVRCLPQVDPTPVLLMLLPWLVGTYVLVPLRWHGISASGQDRRWHLRVYAESELLGMLSPAHAGADLWRVHQLHLAGLDRPTAVADVALDRLLGALGLVLFVAVGGTALPHRVLVAAVALAAVALVAGLLLRRHLPGLLPRRPSVPAGSVVRGLLLSVGYQLTILGLLLGGLAATGYSVPPLALLGVFGASQVAGMLPGVPGAGPREGALVAGLVSLGVPLGSALGAVSVVAVSAWGPALLLGGGLLLLRRIAPSRAV